MSLTPFVTAYDSAIQAAARNPSNWRLLVQKIHPAEPDIIGLLSMVVALCLKRRQRRFAGHNSETLYKKTVLNEEIEYGPQVLGAEAY
jgi:hypothetical protein